MSAKQSPLERAQERIGEQAYHLPSEPVHSYLPSSEIAEVAVKELGYTALETELARQAKKLQEDQLDERILQACLKMEIRPWKAESKNTLASSFYHPWTPFLWWFGFTVLSGMLGLVMHPFLVVGAGMAVIGILSLVHSSMLSGDGMYQDLKWESLELNQLKHVIPEEVTRIMVGLHQILPEAKFTVEKLRAPGAVFTPSDLVFLAKMSYASHEVYFAYWLPPTESQPHPEPYITYTVD